MFQEELENPRNTSPQQCSDKQLKANRDNATASTGPCTPEGKSAVSRNALKHGLCSRSLIIFENDQAKEDFAQLLAQLIEEHNPEGMVENMLVYEMAVTWRMVQVAEGRITRELFSEQKAEGEILTACSDISGIATTGASSSLTCTALVANIERKNPDFTKVDFDDGTPRLNFVAKLVSSAERFHRYQVAWKKDFYRALEKLESLQQSRRAKRVVAA